MAKPQLIEVTIRVGGKSADVFSVLYYSLKQTAGSDYILVVPRSSAEIKELEKLAALRVAKEITPDHKYGLKNVSKIETISIESRTTQPEQPFGYKVKITADTLKDLELTGKQHTLMQPRIRRR